MEDNVLLAFTLTLLAGLCTGIGSLIAFVCKHTNKKFLSICLGFSAGVMIYVSMIEIFVEAQNALVAELGERTGSWATVGAFFCGMLIIGLIDKCLPEEGNPHEVKTVEDGDKPVQENRLMRMGLFTALAIGIHNFPEGLAPLCPPCRSPM